MISVAENPDGDPSEYAYWRSSSNLHGSPFAYDIITEIEQAQEYYATDLQVYPNPTADLLMVQLNSDVQGQSNLRIYDIRGARYLDRDFENYTEVSLGGLDLQSGIYLLEVSTPAGRETRKVIYRPR
jgi:hypothetical protein